jgi:acetylornithine deacetylase/succinyl-diaminopimelate desuccinylase-like protein
LNRFVLVLVLVNGCATAKSAPQRTYDERYSQRLVPMLQEVLRFPTVDKNDKAHADQKAWLARTAESLGFQVRPAGKITEIELAGPPGAPVLGLVLHGDVQPVDDRGWTHPPFAGVVENGMVYGRGSADDKGPLVQALLATAALRDSGLARTHTVRLLVGSEEESNAEEMKEYLKDHAPPDYSLVLDANFPVMVGEKSWNAIALSADNAERGTPREWTIEHLDAGLGGGSIVPDTAELTLRWRGESQPRWTALAERLRAKALPQGTRAVVGERGPLLAIVVHGKAAHSGMNAEGGRNALVALAQLVEGELPASGWADLLAFAQLAGKDLYGSSFGLPPRDAFWGGFTVTPATLKPVNKFWGVAPTPGALQLLVNVRGTPALTTAQLEQRLRMVVKDFEERTGARFEVGGYFKDQPLVLDPNGKLVRRLLAAYGRATGRAEGPRTLGGGSYAKRIPNAVAFGMWFLEAGPYPGHDLDEKIGVQWLQRGSRVLIEALTDIATGPPIAQPLNP